MSKTKKEAGQKNFLPNYQYAKYFIFLGIGILIVILLSRGGNKPIEDNLVGQAATITCADSDGGININTFGTTTGKDRSTGRKVTKSDTCSASGRGIKEYYCNGQYVASKNFGTATGCKSCTNGACSSTPATSLCGNGLLDTGEQCDDGNLINGDGCSSTCQKENLPFQTQLSNLYNLYSPSVYTFQGVKRMLVGGGLDQSDPNSWTGDMNIPGPDKIFYTEFIDGAWTSLSREPDRVFQKIGYLINDPTVIHPPSTDGVDRSNWLYMYFTANPNNWNTGYPGECPDQDLCNNNCPAVFHHHKIGFAFSTDGKKWTDSNFFVLDESNSGNGWGAWVPSAIVVGNEIWVYYNTGIQPSDPGYRPDSMFRQKFNADGWQKIGSPERLQFSPETGIQGLTNMDIHQELQNFVMLANRETLNTVYRYVSGDGLTWTLAETAPIITNPDISGTACNGGTTISDTTTPNVEVLNPISYRVYFQRAHQIISSDYSLS